MAIVLTGKTGLIGSQLFAGLSRHTEIIAPTHDAFDITNKQEVNALISAHAPRVIIHAAAFTDNDTAEEERGDKKGRCWQVNVDGTKNIVDAAKKVGAYVIYISTGSVFAGDDTHQGPFKEEDPTSPQSSLSWYAWTKAVAETLVTNGAIIRLSHPVSKDNQTKHFDYIHTILGLYDKGKLYPLFTDQIFPITYLPDLAAAIINIITSLSSAHEFTVHPSALRHSSYTSGLQILRSDGARNCAPYREVYHVVSVDGVSPFELARYAISKAKGVKDPKLPKTTFDAFVKHVSLPKRYAKYCAIDGSESRKKLGLSDRSWRKIVDCLFP